jgi:predicted nucleotidyltransferase
MRLTENQVETIKELVSRHFASNAKVVLFGSRVDDAARGGDIDLYVETNLSPEKMLKAEMALYAGLQRRLGERSVDIIIHRDEAPLQPVHEEALRTGICL